MKGEYNVDFEFMCMFYNIVKWVDKLIIEDCMLDFCVMLVEDCDKYVVFMFENDFVWCLFQDKYLFVKFLDLFNL